MYFRSGGGETNDVVIMKNGKSVSFSSSVHMIDGLNGLDVNSKKSTNQLYKRIEEMLNIHSDSKFQIVNHISKINSIIDEESMSLSVSLRHDEELSIADLLKMLNYRIDCSLTNILEKLYSYVDTVCEFRNHELLIFINISFYLSSDELEDFFRYMESNKVMFLFIESESYSRVSRETIYIVDEELFESIDCYSDS